jgi:predicted P-loop ATPase
MRNASPADTLKTSLDTYAWADAGSYATQLGPASALFQYALHDDFSPESYVQRYFDLSAGPKEVKFYDADHGLNAKAQRDRFKLLQRHLALESARRDARKGSNGEMGPRSHYHCQSRSLEI